MQFSQFLAIAGFAAMAYAAAMPAPEAAPLAAPNADAEADPGLFTALLREGSHCTEGDWPCDD